MADDKKAGVKKGFFARLMESLDQKMEAKAKSGGCCCCSSEPTKPENTGCC
jgi:hypothetical protein